MDTLGAMEVFVRVVETGGFSAAGGALGLAPSSVSRRVSELEDKLGVRLLRRTTRRLSLTEAGEIYYEHAREIIRSAEAAQFAVAGERSTPRGNLRISVPASIARRHIVPAIADFRARYPAVSVALSVTDRLVDVIGEGFDIALRIGPLADSSLRARKIGEARRIVCASPQYLQRAGNPPGPDHLAEHACLTFRSHPGRNLWRLTGASGSADIWANGPFVADDGEALVAACRAGLGIVLLPEWLVGRELAAGDVVEILADWRPEPASTMLSALFAPGPYVPPNVRSFIDFLAKRFADPRCWRD